MIQEDELKKEGLMLCKKIYTVAYRMTDAEYEGDGAAYVVNVIASNFEKAIAAIKGMFKGCRPRKFSNFTLIKESKTSVLALDTQIIGYPEFYVGFEEED